MSSPEYTPTPRDWVLSYPMADREVFDEHDHLPFRDGEARQGYPTQREAEARRDAVLADLVKQWGIRPTLLVVPRY